MLFCAISSFLCLPPLGPTDLSVKRAPPGSAGGGHHVTRNQLTSSEVATVKQLIVSYRESAAFLYRSAEELEQLLLHQN